jgi:dethiobiotin synthetase
LDTQKKASVEMSKAFFVAGTDTEVGKTYCCEVMLKSAVRWGKSSLGLKPIAAGAELDDEGNLVNEDALRLTEASSVKLPYQTVNPVCVSEPLSPHIAAERAGVNIELAQVRESLEPGLRIRADLTLVEGAGGWRVPISDKSTMADLARVLRLPIILVVGLRLGCINHALLTVEAIHADGLELFGWVANHIDPAMGAMNENLATLDKLIPAPRLGFIPHASSLDDAAVLAQFDMFF